LWVRMQPSFASNRSPKNAGTMSFLFGGQFYVSKTGSEDGLRSTLVDFFHKIKVRQQIGERILLYTSRLLKNEEIRGIFV
jgi:hypothetical protein